MVCLGGSRLCSGRKGQTGPTEDDRSQTWASVRREVSGSQEERLCPLTRPPVGGRLSADEAVCGLLAEPQQLWTPGARTEALNFQYKALSSERPRLMGWGQGRDGGWPAMTVGLQKANSEGDPLSGSKTPMTTPIAGDLTEGTLESDTPA